jgi:glucosamine--fructose-6-phosphate aminotransferase (isomerizing)
MGALHDDILMQPTLFRALASHYATGSGAAALASLDTSRPPLLTGMGASYHAALVAAAQLQACGVAARAVEATDLIFYSAGLLDTGPLVFVSQSGASAEVAPLTAMLPRGTPLLAVTNNPDSPLAEAATAVLPVLAGSGERFVATRTFTSTLAVLWLLARHWVGALADRTALEAIAAAYATALSDHEAIAARWLELLDGAQTLVFLGHGPHAATARQAAMMLSEWARLPALAASAGAFRHGLIEIVQPDTAVVIFAAPGPAQRSSQDLAAELADYGARALLVEHGRVRRPDEPAARPLVADEFLAPLLDILPMQLLADGLPAQLGFAPGFRHIAKVVTRL